MVITDVSSRRMFQQRLFCPVDGRMVLRAQGQRPQAVYEKMFVVKKRKNEHKDDLYELILGHRALEKQCSMIRSRDEQSCNYFFFFSLSLSLTLTKIFSSFCVQFFLLLRFCQVNGSKEIREIVLLKKLNGQEIFNFFHLIFTIG